MTNSIQLLAPAKVNLCLDIVGKRDDGYHLLESLVVFPKIGDQISIAPADKLYLDISGEFASQLCSTSIPDNLIIKAAQLLQKSCNVTTGARITLKKNLPIGAGLGGGSSDAAATLRGLCQLWNIPWDDAAMQTLAAPLGSDMNICLTAKSAWMSNIGEKIIPVKLKIKPWLLLVNPHLPLPTESVYSAFPGTICTPDYMPTHIDTIDALLSLLYSRANSLQSIAIQQLPIIADMLESISNTSNCLLARMSGSGATCFGIYAKESDATEACEEIVSINPKWWIARASL